MLNNKRVRKVIIPITILADKSTLLAVIKQLPEDAQLIEAFSMPTSNHTHHFIFSSKEWEEVGEDELIPAFGVNYFSIEEQAEDTKELDYQSLTNFHNKYTSCMCDFEYTGLRHHKRECPFYKK